MIILHKSWATSLSDFPKDKARTLSGTLREAGSFKERTTPHILEAGENEDSVAQNWQYHSLSTDPNSLITNFAARRAAVMFWRAPDLRV